MSFREITMQEISEMLRRHQAGYSARRIARDMGLDRKTVHRYLNEAQASDLLAGTLVTEEVARSVGHGVQTRPSLPLSEIWQKLAGQRTQIKSWLEGDKPLRLVRVRELLEGQGVHTCYTTLRRYVLSEFGWRKKTPTVRLDDPPAGMEAQVDFGLMGTVVDETGKPRKLHVLIVTLSFSRYSFVWPTWRQTTEEVIAGLEAAWRFFDGVPKHVVFDNMSSVVERAGQMDPKLNRAFQEYAESRGFFADTARVRHPKDKAKVENHVPYVRERWFAGEVFSPDIQTIRQHAEDWCREVAGARTHGTTRKVPRDVYLSEEKLAMLAAPTAPFDIPVWSKAKVHPDHHVQVQKALYSAPTRYIGKVLDARADRTTVRLYCGLDLVKAHARKSPGQRSTDPNDFPPGKAAWALRDVDSVVRAARSQGERIGEFAERLLAGPVPWLKLRQAYGLLRLCDRYGRERVNALCQRALAFEVFDVSRLEGMLKDARRTEDEEVAKGKVIPLPSRFARDNASFATRPLGTSHSEGGQP